MKKIQNIICTLLLFMLIFLSSKTIAQELETPLYANKRLMQYENLNNKNIAIKTTQNNTLLNKIYNTNRFPFIDNFDSIENRIVPDNDIWYDDDVTVINNYAIFNALNKFNTLHNKAGKLADELTSNNINTSNITIGTYISFNYATGSSWQSGDSLVLQIKNIDQTWRSIWFAPNVAMPYTEVLFDINLVKYKFSDFQFRFQNYCHLSDSNKQNYILSKVVFTYKGQLGFNDDFKIFNTQDSTPTGYNWAYHQNKIKMSADVNYTYGNAIIFDAQNSSYKTYFKSNNQYGGADTLLSVPFDLVSRLRNEDSLSLSFYYRALPNAKNYDSLILECRNKLNNWVRIWAIKASPSADYSLYTKSISDANFRHKFFQFRLVNKTNYTNSDTLKWALSGVKFQHKIFLPFFDDFSTSKDYPREDIWVDKNVFINNDFPVNPPSFNVATFDGLDEYGNAYSKQPIKGHADRLTTASFNIEKYHPQDSLYLSFQYQYQPQGNTDAVFPDDSLMVYLRSNANDVNAFEPVLLISAEEAITNQFVEVVLPIKDSFFFHNDFQVQFINRGSLTGNLSQWHIDYVRLGIGRSFADTNINDVAIVSTPTNLLNKYRSIPYSHYSLNPAKYIADTQYIAVYNNNDKPYALDYRRRIYEPNGTQNFLSANVISTFNSKSDTLIFVSNTSPQIAFNSSIKTDSLVFTNTFRITNNGFKFNDQVPSNDSISSQTIFSNYFAYDDGTAESGYAIRGKNNCGAALAFDLEQTDSMYGMYVFYNQAESNINTQQFDLIVWRSISGLDGYNALAPNIELYKIPKTKVIHTNKINGFAYYKFDSAIAVPKRFYIGWSQVSPFLLNIGLDKNYTINGQKAANPNIYSFYDGVWNPTIIKGALMMRPIVGKWINPILKVNEIEKQIDEIKVYPNPASRLINIGNSKQDIFDITLYDLCGKELLHKNLSNTIDIQMIQNGVYILHISNEDKLIYKNVKIIINN